jgi:hypothetical protein
MAVLFAVVPLVLAATWLGAMAYSLTVVQPKVASCAGGDRRLQRG